MRSDLTKCCTELFGDSMVRGQGRVQPSLTAPDFVASLVGSFYDMIVCCNVTRVQHRSGGCRCSVQCHRTLRVARRRLGICIL